MSLAYTTDANGNIVVQSFQFLDDPALTGAHTIILQPESGVVTHGADTVFASDSGHSTMFLAGIDAQGNGSTGVLGSGAADVVLGQNATLYGGSHDVANVTFNTGTVGERFITGSGTYNVLNDPSGAGVIIGGGLDHQMMTTAGLVDYGKNGSVTHLFAAGPVSGA